MSKLIRNKSEDFHDKFGYEMYLDRLFEALEAARDHLRYCNYGDSWERECAQEQKLDKLIEDALKEEN